MEKKKKTLGVEAEERLGAVCKSLQVGQERRKKVVFMKDEHVNEGFDITDLTPMSLRVELGHFRSFAEAGEHRLCRAFSDTAEPVKQGGSHALPLTCSAFPLTCSAFR